MPPIDAVLGEDGYVVQPIVNLTTPPATSWAHRALISGSYGTSRGMAFFTDVGEHGTLMQWTGTRWRAVNGTASLKTLGAPATGITNTESLPLQTLVPAGTWQVNDTMRVWIGVAKSGTTDAGNVIIRVGTAGAATDTSVGTFSSLLSAATRSIVYVFDFKLASATTVQRVGSGYSGTTGSAAPAAVTITDSSANALYVSVGMASASTTDTLTLQSGQIQLLTP